MTVKTYDIQELVTTSGMPRRTIYFYVQQGILPPPEGAGLAAHYNEEHLLRLQLVPALRRQGLRLDEIRARFQQLSVEEMRQMREKLQMQQQHVEQLRTVHPAPAAPRSINENVPGILPMPAIPGTTPGWGEQRFTHYALPAGMALVAPESLSPADRLRLQQLLEAARHIFSGAPYYAMDAGPNPNDAIKPAESRTSEEE